MSNRNVVRCVLGSYDSCKLDDAINHHRESSREMPMHPNLPLRPTAMTPRMRIILQRVNISFCKKSSGRTTYSLKY